MSLRSFHILFIVLAALLCALLAGWSLWRAAAGWPGGPWLGGLAAAATAALVPYLRWFVRSRRVPA